MLLKRSYLLRRLVMKKLSLFTILIIFSALTLHTDNSYAGDDEWATVGKILTGVVGGGIVHNIFSDSGCRRDYYPSGQYFSYGYYSPGVSFHFGSDGYGYPPHGYYRYPRYPRHYYRPRHHRRSYCGRRRRHHRRH